jgi:hypothetical protein
VSTPPEPCDPELCAEPIPGRAMRDEDGPAVAQAFYEKLFEGTIIENDAIPRALDDAVRKLRDDGVSPERWATFMHIGA